MDYQKYLQTEHWQARRKLALDEAGHKCQVCGCKDRRLDVHHNSYDYLGDEPREDLIVLCDVCHERHHKAPSHVTYTGMVCPDCGTEWVLELSIMYRVHIGEEPMLRSIDE